jgi:hypothetical protein
MLLRFTTLFLSSLYTTLFASFFISLCSSWFPWSTPLVWLVMRLGSWVVQHQRVMLDVIPNSKPRKTRVHSLNQLSKCGNLRISAWWKVEATWGPLLPWWNKVFIAVSSKETLCGSCFWHLPLSFAIWCHRLEPYFYPPACSWWLNCRAY